MKIDKIYVYVLVSFIIIAFASHHVGYIKGENEGWQNGWETGLEDGHAFGKEDCQDEKYKTGTICYHEDCCLSDSHCMEGQKCSGSMYAGGECITPECFGDLYTDCPDGSEILVKKCIGWEYYNPSYDSDNIKYTCEAE